MCGQNRFPNRVGLGVSLEKINYDTLYFLNHVFMDNRVGLEVYHLQMNMSFLWTFCNLFEFVQIV